MTGPPDEDPAAVARPRARAFLLPGMMHCNRRRAEVSTVLGSCVAVCLTDRCRGISGINHFVLPTCDGDGTSLRYGDVSIARLVASMKRLCGTLETVEAKVFGGAEILAPLASPGIGVGARNVALALERLDQLGLPVVARRTGDVHGLLIRLHTDTGEVMVRPVQSTWPAGRVQARAAIAAAARRMAVWPFTVDPH
ncbi:chemotaxis protein CheD [Siculibacillus lacustris]|uniref:Probable chemoreceptor glutamine deamidase CheD n=1 Tax=Siculibacillus lacustris TaxID=1549641 RepID=A0A4Q9VRE5_9HYPH|nr:chemotaxis protein CheD [Siculibacillus lacustris]TBW37607.1 chemotaxis protein CheD [Siculibacillus lacustris]